MIMTLSGKLKLQCRSPNCTSYTLWVHCTLSGTQLSYLAGTPRGTVLVVEDSVQNCAEGTFNNLVKPCTVLVHSH